MEQTAGFAESLQKAQTEHSAAMTVICERLHKLEDQRGQSTSSDSGEPGPPKVSDLAKTRGALAVKLSVSTTAFLAQRFYR